MSYSNLIQIKGNRANFVKHEFEPVTLTIQGNTIVDIALDSKMHPEYLIPGWVDAHIHLESSMLLPAAFSAQARLSGTLSFVADPHEIANVCGLPGIVYFLEQSKNLPLYPAYMIPSCVPASPWDLSGHTISSQEVQNLIYHPLVHGLAEVMNVPGVLRRDPEVMDKIRITHEAEKKVDGHCPGLSGSMLEKYCRTGINTDHECTSEREAIEKIRQGMKILIREGSAAKNLQDLLPVLDQYPESCMFCTDDLHPDDLMKGHLHPLLIKACHEGIDLWKVLRCASLNPINHYSLPLGLLRKGDSADFLILDDLESFHLKGSFFRGKCFQTTSNGESLLPCWVNQCFNPSFVFEEDFILPPSNLIQRVIGASDGELLTREIPFTAHNDTNEMLPDIDKDILRIALINRYKPSKPVCAWVHGIGLKQGAFASSIAHDSHHILVVGQDRSDMAKAVNTLVEIKGGLAAVCGSKTYSMKLPFAGLMSLEKASETAMQYQHMDALVKSWGTELTSPFMTLSFLSLLVIPELKLGEKGLFNGTQYTWVSNTIA